MGIFLKLCISINSNGASVDRTAETRVGIYLSFTEFTTVKDATWVGISNYKKIFLDQNFLNALKITSVLICFLNIFLHLFFRHAVTFH